MSKSDEINLDQFAKLFDAALASDNPSVKKALRNFLFIASIAEAEAEAEGGDRPEGPFSYMLREIQVMKKEIAELKMDIQTTRGTASKDYYYGNWNTYLDDHKWAKNVSGIDTQIPSKYSGTSTSAINSAYKDVLDAIRKTGSSGDL